MVGTRIAHYVLGRQVGSGGMGAVYEATDEQTHVRVAIKVLRKEFTQNREALTRFVNEARATNLIDHPSMVKIFGSGTTPDGTAYLVMEFLEGETLSARLRRQNGPLPEMEVRRLGWQLAAVLADAHKKSIIHRDLKPGNVMLVNDPASPGIERAKLLDFGIAKLDVRSLNLEDPQTRAGIMMGTPQYMSPEQCRGAAQVDDRSDSYSLGVILFQMLTGRLPFIPAEEGDGMVMAMHIYEQPPRPRDLVPTISEGMQQLVLDMLKKDRAERPVMSNVCSRLEDLGGSMGIKVDLSVTFEDNDSTRKVPQVPTVRMGGLREMATLVSMPSLPSTLGGGTGQVTRPSEIMAPVPKPRRFLQFGAIGGLLLVGVVAIGLSLRKTPTPVPQPPVTDKLPTDKVDAPKPATTLLRCQLDSDPSGAQVVREADGVLLGKTPWKYEHAPDGTPLVLLLKQAGFGDRALALDCQATPNRMEKLDRIPTDPGPRVTPKSKPTPKGKGKGKGKPKGKAKKFAGKKPNKKGKGKNGGGAGNKKVDKVTVLE